MILDGAEILAIATDRERAFAGDHARMTNMAKIWSGKHRQLFPREFPPDDVDKNALLIRRTWQMFARACGKVPDVQVAALSLSDADKRRAEKQENICFAYNQSWEMRRRMAEIARYFVGFGAFACGVFPDVRRVTPKLLVEDPRNVLPGASWEATTLPTTQGYATVAEWGTVVADPGAMLADCIVRKVLTTAQLLDCFGPRESIMRRAHSGKASANYTDVHVVLMWYDTEHVVSLFEDNGELIDAAPHNTGWCPWIYGTLFSPGGEPATSDLEQQVGLEIAFMRVLNQKLALNDAVAYPWLFTRGNTQADPRNRIIEGLTPDSQAQFITPPATFQVDRDLALIRDLMRSLNFETEASQGDVTGGPITARGIVELGRVTTETIQSFFDDFGHYLPKLYTTALAVDVNMFGDVTKSVSGQGRGEPFFTDYTPAKDIGANFGRVTVEFGPGLGGYEGHLQMLQDLGADAISVETVMEHNPHIRSISKEKRRIEMGKLERFAMEQALTGQSAVPVDWIAQAVEAIGKGQRFLEFALENPPTQSTATPAGTPPIPPELAAQMQAMAGGAPPEEAMAEEAMVFAPPLEALMGGG